MNLTLAVGIIGSLTGLAAGLASTYLAVASAIGPRERSFMMRGALVCWTLVGLVMVGRMIFPGVGLGVSLVAVAVLVPALRWWSDRQVEIRLAERTERAQRAGELMDERRSRLW